MAARVKTDRSAQNSQSTLKEGGGVGEAQQSFEARSEKSLLVWTAPSRPFKRRSSRFWMTVFALAMIFSFILFFAEGVMPVIVLVSIVLLFYVLSTVEPEKIEYAFTNKGVKIAGERTNLRQLGRFWFTRRFDDEVLVIETSVLPGRLELVVNRGDKQKIKEVLSAYLSEEEIPPSGLDQVANWFSRKISY